MPNPLKVLLVDDDWTVRSAVREYLLKHEFAVAEAASRESAIERAASFLPDVAVIDIVLPESDGGRTDFNQDTGIEIARQLRARFPCLGIVFLSAYFDRSPEVTRLFMDGQDRIVYLLKGSRPQELYNAILNVAEDGAGLQIAGGVRAQRQSIFDRVFETLSAPERACAQRALARLETLSEPENRVFAAVGSCLTRQQAAEILSLSTKTINSHMDTIYTKLGLSDADPGLNPLALFAKIYLLSKLKENQ